MRARLHSHVKSGHSWRPSNSIPTRSFVVRNASLARSPPRGNRAGVRGAAHTLENSFKKAYTANAQRRPSGDFAKAVQGNPGAGGLRLGLVPAQGAVPIKVGEDTIGAIGVSGAPGVR
jgi:hypothetical protein